MEKVTREKLSRKKRKQRGDVVLESNEVAVTNGNEPDQIEVDTNNQPALETEEAIVGNCEAVDAETIEEQTAVSPKKKRNRRHRRKMHVMIENDAEVAEPVASNVVETKQLVTEEVARKKHDKSADSPPSKVTKGLKKSAVADGDGTEEPGNGRGHLTRKRKQIVDDAAEKEAEQPLQQELTSEKVTERPNTKRKRLR